MTGATLLRVGSRASPLARAQAEWVVARLPICNALVWVKSRGDADRVTALPDFGRTGVFTAALHHALFEDRIDAAVHSLKDLPVGDEEGVTLCCVPAREDPRDVLIARDEQTLATLPEGARLGTGSPRRAAQLLRCRPDLEVVPIRGNVHTRLQKVQGGEVDATVLALAAIRRLALHGVASEILDPDVCLPAAGQGALGITIRAGDVASEEVLARIRDVKAAACTAAERASLHALGAGCHAPVGALAEVEDGRLRLRVRVLSDDGQVVVEASEEASLAEADVLGRQVADRLLADGARPLLADVS